MRCHLFSLCVAALLATGAGASPVAITHVRLIDGAGGPPIEDATLVIDGGRIVAAGRSAAVPPGARRLDYTGRTALPGLISDHSHVGAVLGATTGPQNYTREVIAGQLAQYRRYGVTTVTALGNNRPLFDALRREAHAGRLAADLFGVDQGIGVPNGAPPQGALKSAPDQLFRPATPAEARAAVDRMAAEKTDLVKIWVDDFAGTVPVKMSPRDHPRGGGGGACQAQPRRRAHPRSGRCGGGGRGRGGHHRARCARSRGAAGVRRDA